jgi:ribosomal protein S27E
MEPMSDDDITEPTARAELLASVVGPCPICGNGHLRAVFDGELTNFLCIQCKACWHGDLAWVHRVEPVNCPGCPSRPVCLAAARGTDYEARSSAWASVASMRALCGGPSRRELEEFAAT